MTTSEIIAEKEAIRMVKARYFRFVDTKDWDSLAQLFTEDCQFDISDDMPSGGIFNGRDAIMAMVKAGLTEAVSVHHGHAQEIEFVSANEANSICPMEDMLWWPESSSSPIKHLHGYGHYFERYQKRAGHWQIAALTMKRLRVEHVPR